MWALRRLWRRLNRTLWFTPSVMLAASIGLSLLLIEVDARYDARLGEFWPRLFGVSPEGAREILSSIATSIITVAGVTFSIIVVALSLSANQYSPRVLRNFMQDRGNQMALGYFVGTFAYALSVLRTIRTGGDEFVPALAVVGAILLAVLSVGVLLYFIHHVSESIEASHLISTLAAETIREIDELDETLGLQSDEDEDEGPWQTAPAARTGYVQTLDTKALARFQRRGGGLVRIESGVGQFVIEGSPLVSVRREKPLTRREISRLNASFEISEYRTVGQDVRYGVRQMVDIALRALSPGVNDPGTAATCIDFLSAVLCHFAGARARGEGKTPDRLTLSGLITEAYDPIRRSAENSFETLIRILEALERISGRNLSGEDKATVWDQAALAREAAERAARAGFDTARIRELVWRIRRALDEEAPVYNHQA
jgi:uncharacterized membrane protein